MVFWKLSLVIQYSSKAVYKLLDVHREDPISILNWTFSAILNLKIIPPERSGEGI